MSGVLRIAALLLVATAGCVTERVAPELPPPTNGVRKYIVMLEGRNFQFDSESGPTRLGFFTTRHIEARSSEEAERRAEEEVLSDVSLRRSILNPPEDPPRVHATRSIAVESFDSDSSQNLGYIFYTDRDTR